ncbi:hypothetical protein pb186bvf_000347 [Paramecium bursaria]
MKNSSKYIDIYNQILNYIIYHLHQHKIQNAPLLIIINKFILCQYDLYYLKIAQINKFFQFKFYIQNILQQKNQSIIRMIKKTHQLIYKFYIMVCCVICSDDGNYGILRQNISNSNLKKDKMGLNYEPYCAKCLYKKLRNNDEVYQNALEKECPDILFYQSQINQGILSKLRGLSQLINQGEHYIDQIYRRQHQFVYQGQFRQRISQSILPIIQQLSSEFISSLYEAIKFATIETNKIKKIKQKIELVLNEYGDVSLLNHEDYLNICQQDIKKYNVENMMHLADKIQQAKERITFVLNLDD